MNELQGSAQVITQRFGNMSSQNEGENRIFNYDVLDLALTDEVEDCVKAQEASKKL